MDHPCLTVPKGIPCPIDYGHTGVPTRAGSAEEQQIVDAWRIANASEYVNACKRYVLEELETLGISPDQGGPVSERIVRNLIADRLIRSLLEYGDCDSRRPDEFEGFQDFVKSTFGMDWQDPRPYSCKERT